MLTLKVIIENDEGSEHIITTAEAFTVLKRGDGVSIVDEFSDVQFSNTSGDYGDYNAYITDANGNTVEVLVGKFMKPDSGEA